MNTSSFALSWHLTLKHWLAAGLIAVTLVSAIEPARAADVTCLGYNGRVSAGGGLLLYDVTCEDSVCVLASGSGTPKTATGCLPSTISDHDGLGHEFGDAEGDVTLTFSPSANGAILSGTASAHGIQKVGLPGLCTGGSGMAGCRTPVVCFA